MLGGRLSPPVSRSHRGTVERMLWSDRQELWPATHPQAERRSTTSEHNDLDQNVVKCFKPLVFYLEHRQYPVPDCNPHVPSLPDGTVTTSSSRFWLLQPIPQLLAMAPL